MTADWRAALAAARQPTSRAQDVWDARWCRAYATARRMGRTPNQAVEVASRRAAKHGPRPEAS